MILGCHDWVWLWSVQSPRPDTGSVINGFLRDYYMSLGICFGASMALGRSSVDKTIAQPDPHRL